MRGPVLAAVALLLLLRAPPSRGDHFDPARLEYNLPPDTIESIDDPAFESPEYLVPDDEVIGVAIGPDARAYPLKVLRVHEVVNDVVGGVPVVVSYCSLCGTAVAHERPLWNGTPVLFHTSGLLFLNNKVLCDTATGSHWPQLLGEAVDGPFHGTRLVPVSSTRTTWGEWRGTHAESLVLARPHACTSLPCPGGIDYEGDSYESILVPVGNGSYVIRSYYRTEYTFKEWRHPDRRLFAKDWVLGVRLKGVAVAYPLNRSFREPVINDVVGGVPIVVTYWNPYGDLLVHPGYGQAFFRGGRGFTAVNARTMRDEAGRIFSLIDGSAAGAPPLPRVQAIQAFWFAWKDLHPETAIYGIDWPERCDFDCRPLAAILAGVVMAGIGAAAAVSAVRPLPISGPRRRPAARGPLPRGTAPRPRTSP